MECFNLASTPGLTVTEKEWADAEQLPFVLAGHCQRVTGRLLYVAGWRRDAQPAVKEVARGMSSPMNYHCARLM